MRIELERRSERLRIAALLSPVYAVGLTVVFGGVLFTLFGHDPFQACFVYFVEPLLSGWSLQELAVKATPLTLIAVGLIFCFVANVWNIGAEGQFTVGAITGALLPILLPDWQLPIVLPLMLVLGALGGALYAAIPALLRTRFGVSEILSSLMLVYVAQLYLDWLVRGPLRDPDGFNFPQSRLFHDSATLPTLFDGRMHIGVIIVGLVVIGAALVMAKTLTGYQIKVVGAAPRAARFAGFNAQRTIWVTMLVSGALAGLAGIIEVAGPIGQLVPTISPGYGFAAIIVAFLGRLNPVGALFAALVLAVSYLGGEGVQAELGVTDKIARVMQGMLLFFVLVCDTLIYYRLKLVRATRLLTP